MTTVQYFDSGAFSGSMTPAFCSSFLSRANSIPVSTIVPSAESVAISICIVRLPQNPAQLPSYMYAAVPSWTELYHLFLADSLRTPSSLIASLSQAELQTEPQTESQDIRTLCLQDSRNDFSCKSDSFTPHLLSPGSTSSSRFHIPGLFPVPSPVFHRRAR